MALLMGMARSVLGRVPRAAVVGRTYSTTPAPAVTMLSESETMLKDTVRAFAEKSIGPLVASMDETQTLDRGILQECFDQGLMGMEIPAEYEGGNMKFFDAILTIEELARVDPSVSVVVDVQNTLINNAFIRYTTEEQRQRYLPRLATNTLGSFCLSEWGSGSDAFAMKTRAVQDGDHFVINGTKAWITNSGEAELFLVFANADPEKGYKGITAFVMDRDTPGLEVGKKEDKLGIRASSTCEVNLTDVRVHKDQLIGEYGKGYQIAIGTLNEGRIGIAAQMLGLAQGAFDKTMPYINQRQQFGSPIADFQAMRHQYARLAVEIHAARCVIYNAARLKDAGQPFVSEAAMAKLYASEVAEKTASLCVNMLGGVGFTRELGVEKYFRDCKIGQIYEGTSNVQLDTIAKNIQKEYK
eukprot:CAMPEP_0119131348 /NCGR_PEP_ID=MMETSP1310-20130426/10089_1 /TAXON_ID=464262 /ORGANISM="Genus nov. species nov., Strain RCC2339" /LENGTH=412 /DNA_ID=CAMNT_0007121915 /DNA_START=64 /DNA_END=1302 /DNA_ORIENTATION=+